MTENYQNQPAKKGQEDLIERYIYDTVRRLPESERTEVMLELRANIADMLPESAAMQNVQETLIQLGSPQSLANQYQPPRYLISPLLYDTYIQVLKMVVAIVATVAAVGGAVAGIPSISNMIGGAVWTGLQGALQAAFWTTIGFVIAEKSGYVGEEWNIAALSNLPKIPTTTDGNISKISSVVGIFLSVIFTIGCIYWILAGGTFLFAPHEFADISLFSQVALMRAIPFVIIMGAAGLVSNVVFLRQARWNVATCFANIVHTVVIGGIMLHMLYWGDLFNMNLLEHSLIADSVNDVRMAVGDFQWRHVVAVIIVASSLWGIGDGVWKTVKGVRKRA
ncbi:MAG: hypothetical protein FWG65_07245 [Turicibacter sp.]|nr:hypothetical protein [Turicibacter sp.]